jgi:hypothetical protein
MKHTDVFKTCILCGKPFTKRRGPVTCHCPPGIGVWSIDGGGRLAHWRCEKAFQSRLDFQRRMDWKRRQEAKSGQAGPNQPPV